MYASVNETTLPNAKGGQHFFSAPTHFPARLENKFADRHRVDWVSVVTKVGWKSAMNLDHYVRNNKVRRMNATYAHVVKFGLKRKIKIVVG